MSEFIDKAFIILVGVGGLYFMIFHTEKCREVSELGRENTNRIFGGAAKVGKAGYTIFKMLRK